MFSMFSSYLEVVLGKILSLWEIYGKYFLSEEIYTTTLGNFGTLSPDKGRFSAIYHGKNLADFFLHI